MTFNLAPVASTAVCVAAVLFSNRTHLVTARYWQADVQFSVFELDYSYCLCLSWLLVLYYRTYWLKCGLNFTFLGVLCNACSRKKKQTRNNGQKH